jgi:hypothetical protein
LDARLLLLFVGSACLDEFLSKEIVLFKIVFPTLARFGAGDSEMIATASRTFGSDDRIPNAATQASGQERIIDSSIWGTVLGRQRCSFGGGLHGDVSLLLGASRRGRSFLFIRIEQTINLDHAQGDGIPAVRLAKQFKRAWVEPGKGLLELLHPISSIHFSTTVPGRNLQSLLLFVRDERKG